MSDRVVLLAGPGDSTDIVANYLAPRVPELVMILEEAPSRMTLARRRARRMGRFRVAGQVVFVVVALPILRRVARQRKTEILVKSGLDPTPYPPSYRVSSVNDSKTAALLEHLQPCIVVVNGTRIISDAILHSVSCPVINLHAGVTPRYRGVHGGYWALAEGRPDQVGTTVHLVDSGIDTGGPLGWATFGTEPADSIATYPYLHLVAGLPLLVSQVDRALRGEKLVPESRSDPAERSRLYHHPTLWEYLRLRITRRVR